MNKLGKIWVHHPWNLRLNALFCLVHISIQTSTVKTTRKRNVKWKREKKLPAYIKKCLILWIPLNWLRKSDGMSKEWTSPVNMHLNCTSVLFAPQPQNDNDECDAIAVADDDDTHIHSDYHSIIMAKERFLTRTSQSRCNLAARWIFFVLSKSCGISDGFDGILINQTKL